MAKKDTTPTTPTQKMIVEVGEILSQEEIHLSGSNNYSTSSGTVYVARGLPFGVVVHWYVLKQDYDEALVKQMIIEEEKNKDKNKTVDQLQIEKMREIKELQKQIEEKTKELEAIK